MKTIFSLCLGLVASVLATSAKADVIFSIDLDTGTAGIQNVRQVGAGETFQAAIVMQITGATNVAAFSFGLTYDNTELTLNTDPTVSISVAGRPPGFNQVNPIVINNTFTPTTGRIRPFDALSLAGLTTTTATIAVITFQGVNPSDLGGTDITLAQQVTGIDDILDGNTFVPIPAGIAPGDGGVFFNGGTINAVPEPTTWLFGTVLAGFGARRLRKRFARKSEKTEPADSAA